MSADRIIFTTCHQHAKSWATIGKNGAITYGVRPCCKATEHHRHTIYLRNDPGAPHA